MDAKKIEIAVLRQACNLIFQFIENDLKINSIELDNELYWSLTTEERKDLREPPIPSCVGNLLDDYDFVRLLLKNNAQAVPLMFEHIAPLLAVLADQLPNSK